MNKNIKIIKDIQINTILGSKYATTKTCITCATALLIFFTISCSTGKKSENNKTLHSTSKTEHKTVTSKNEAIKIDTVFNQIIIQYINAEEKWAGPPKLEIKINLKKNGTIELKFEPSYTLTKNKKSTTTIDAKNKQYVINELKKIQGFVIENQNSEPMRSAASETNQEACSEKINVIYSQELNDNQNIQKETTICNSDTKEPKIINAFVNGLIKMVDRSSE